MIPRVRTAAAMGHGSSSFSRSGKTSPYPTDAHETELVGPLEDAEDARPGRERGNALADDDVRDLGRRGRSREPGRDFLQSRGVLGRRVCVPDFTHAMAAVADPPVRVVTFVACSREASGESRP